MLRIFSVLLFSYALTLFGSTLLAIALFRGCHCFREQCVTKSINRTDRPFLAIGEEIDPLLHIRVKFSVSLFFLFLVNHCKSWTVVVVSLTTV